VPKWAKDNLSTQIVFVEALHQPMGMAVGSLGISFRRAAPASPSRDAKFVANSPMAEAQQNPNHPLPKGDRQQEEDMRADLEEQHKPRDQQQIRLEELVKNVSEGRGGDA
jgi:hypothetical protein